MAPAKAPSKVPPKKPSGGGLPEDLKRLQEEVLAGLDPGPDSGSEEGGDGPKAPPEDEAEVTEALVLDAAGERRIEDVCQLVLRERNFESLATSRALDFSRLAGLEVLSLSHNRLKDIRPLAAVVSLVEVNLNFNCIVDLSPLFECELLEKLFAANNEIESVAGLDEGCPNLREVSLFANHVSDAQEVLRTLQGLPELRALDIGGNACCEGPSQRYALLQALPLLESLDGQLLGGLDRRLASDFFEGAGRGDDETGEGPTEEKKPATPEPPQLPRGLPQRPGTAPALLSSKPPPLPPSSGSVAAAALAPLLPGQRLRSARANRMDDMLTGSREASPEADAGGLPSFSAQRLDTCDPERVLRALRAHAGALRERLISQRAERENLRFQMTLLQRDKREAKPAQLRERVELLEAENRSGSAVESERLQLQGRLAEVERQLSELPVAAAAAEAGPPPKADDEDEDVVAELRWENQLLAKRLDSTARYAEQLHQEFLRARLQSSQRRQLEAASSRPSTSAGAAADGLSSVTEGGDGEGDEDPEIAKLLGENEATLRRLRGEVRDTATAMARRGQEALAPAPPGPGKRGTQSAVDVLTIGDGAPDVEWHAAR
mmetsp:Transcript_136232/g.303506  ORF Transcript_136232/g.303506 Transcript_136232/m.303506 type:complete len:607 (-) Transcript_136232:75-1895(-)